MRIIDDIKLDFSDVLITPKRSQLISRKDVDLTRKFTFKHSRREWTGVPIVASNMDHTGTIQMFNVMSEHDMLTALCKFIDFPQDGFQYLMKTVGIDTDFDFPTPNWLCIDVANGYTERFIAHVLNARRLHPDSIIVAGKVCVQQEK